MTRPTTTKRPTAAPAPQVPKAKAAAAGRRIQVKRSGVHGKGVFAVQPIAAGETIIEYVGEVISWEEAQRRHPHDLCDPNHTFYFHIDGDHVIDALFDGNASKWINHACDPNCESDERDGRIFIQAVRDIAAGEELNYDYGLVLDERYTAKLKAEYACHCGAADCRGTMLAPKRGVKLAARPAKPEPKQAPKAESKPKDTDKAKAESAGKGKAAEAKLGSKTAAKPVPKADAPSPVGKPKPKPKSKSKSKAVSAKPDSARSLGKGKAGDKAEKPAKPAKADAKNKAKAKKKPAAR